MRELDNPYETGPQSVGFESGANRLWIDRAPAVSQAELWLQLTTANTPPAADRLGEQGVARCDEIEPLGTTSAFWITSPASIVQLASGPESD